MRSFPTDGVHIIKIKIRISSLSRRHKALVAVGKGERITGSARSRLGYRYIAQIWHREQTRQTNYTFFLLYCWQFIRRLNWNSRTHNLPEDQRLTERKRERDRTVSCPCQTERDRQSRQIDSQSGQTESRLGREAAVGDTLAQLSDSGIIWWPRTKVISRRGNRVRSTLKWKYAIYAHTYIGTYMFSLYRFQGK